jgi:TPR repeat protein
MERATKQGNNNTQFQLAWVYANGEDMPIDLNLTKEWYKKSSYN